MDRKHFLDSQLWLLRLSKEAVEELQTDFKFHSLLTNAYCCFQIDKKIVYLSTGASSSYDSTQLLLEVLIAVDNDLERSAMGRHTSAPGLYFILDGVYYIVNHTHICNISVPQISANGEEPPSAFIGWQGVQMRWWLGRDIAANLAVQKLSHAIKAMNDVLLPWCLSHKCITSARLTRRLDVVAPRSTEKHNYDRDGDNDGDNNLDHDDDGDGDGATATRIGCRTNSNNSSSSSSSSSSSAANADSRANAALRSRSSSPRNALMKEKEKEKEKVKEKEKASGSVAASDAHPVQIDLTSTSLSHRFESWMSFMEITSDLLAKAVTPGFICDSFLSAKMTQDSSHRSGVVPYKHQNVDLIQNLDADHALNGSTTQPSSFSGVEVEDDQLLSRPRKKARSSVSSACMSEKKDSVYDEVEETTGHNSAARHFLRGIMSLEEAASVEEAQEAMRKKKETALQTLIKDFYSYSYSVQGSDALKTSTSTTDHSLEKASNDRRLLLQMTTLLEDMNTAAEDTALLRAMPRSQDL